MCGRTACALHSETLQRACEYQNSSGKRCKAGWHSGDMPKYSPSTNIGPRETLPCLIKGSHLNSKEERVLCPMMWGLIPPNYQGDYRKHNISTHNGRLEGLHNSRLYIPPLKNGRRCVIVCEGYYEWKTEKSRKKPQPYYLYATQAEGIKVEDSTTWSDKWSKASGWKGINLLKIAGIFNSIKNGKGKTVYSCTMITTEANDVLSWLHHRTPVILSTEEDVEVWLNYKSYSMDKALQWISNLTLKTGVLSWHQVSTMVNSVMHKTDDCRRPVDPEREEKAAANFMSSWLQKGFGDTSKRKIEAIIKEEADIDDLAEPIVKLIKTE